MEYIYAAMLLHKAGKEITADNVKKIIESTGITPDEGKIKALIAALEGVNIEEAIKQAAVAPASAPAESGKAEAKEEKKPKEEKKSDEQAAAGLGALFG